MDNALISIVIPVYNVECYLEQCIDSIIHQSYNNLEIVLVDDGSSDNCGNICDEYANRDNRIKVIHKENGGLSSARNTGIDLATGEFIAFIDADDCIHSEFIKKLYNSIIQDKTDIAQCDYTREYDEFVKIMVNDKTSIISANEALKRLNDIQIYGKYVITCNKLYKKDLFYDIKFPVGKIHEDAFTTYKVFYRAHTLSIIPEKLYYYRRNPNSITQKGFSLKNLDVFEGYESELKFFEGSDIYKYVCNLYQHFIKRYYFELRQSNIEGKKMYERDLIKKGRKNIKDILKSDVLSVQLKMKELIFITFPFLYERMCFIKDKIIQGEKYDT